MTPPSLAPPLNSSVPCDWPATPCSHQLRLAHNSKKAQLVVHKVEKQNRTARSSTVTLTKQSHLEMHKMLSFTLGGHARTTKDTFKS